MKPTVPIPARMRHLPLDERGYPCPVIVMWTGDGKPIFAANDEGARQRCFNNDLCHICGQRLHRGRWFISGQYSALAENGFNLDGPLHGECAHYALLVCPYLAAPTYGKLVAKQQIARTDRKDVMLLPDETAGLSRPEVFAATMAVGQELQHATLEGGLLQIVRNCRPRPGTIRQVEFWRHGKQIREASDIAAIVADVIDLLSRAGAQQGIRADVQELLR